MLLFNIVLALIWDALGGQFTLPTFATGFVMGYVLLTFLSRRRAFTSALMIKRWDKAIFFLFFYFWEVILSNLKTAIHVINPRQRLKTAIIAVPLDLKNESEIMLLSNLIMLTPGTLSLDVSTDRSTLYVHVLDLKESPEAFRENFRKGFEHRVQEIFQL